MPAPSPSPVQETDHRHASDRTALADTRADERAVVPVAGACDDRVRGGDEGLRARTSTALARRLLRDRQGRVRLRRRRLRARASRRLIRLLLKELEPTARPDHRRRPRPRPAQALEGAAAPAQRRLRLPGLQAAPEPHRVRERRLRAQGAGREPATRSARKVPEVLSLVGLSHKMNSLPDELSGGEQQRVSIARAFVNHPPLLDLRRADGEPRPRHVRRDHAAPLPDQPRRHDDPDGHARPRDGRQDAQARDRARGRARSCATSAAGGTAANESSGSSSPRRCARCGANALDDGRGDDDRADRDVPARPVDRARHAGSLSWSDHVEERARRCKVVLLHDAHVRDERLRPAGRARSRLARGEPDGQGRRRQVRLQGGGAQDHAASAPGARRANLPYNPLPDAFEVRRSKAEDVGSRSRRACAPQQRRRREGRRRRSDGRADPPASRKVISIDLLRRRDRAAGSRRRC